MERLGNDLLFTIFTHIHNPKDQVSFAQVSKQFLKVACHHLIKLHISFPDFLYDVLPESPNLISFTCSKPLSNTHMNLLAQSCPKLKYLNLGLDQSWGSKIRSHLYGQSDFDDDGLCSIANSCSNLRLVDLRKRLNVGDVAIITLVRSSKCLKVLDLWGCVNVTNKSLQAIGESNLQGLSLQGCHLITDLGLKYLVNGNVRNHLIEIVVAECNGITDAGIIDLKKMKCKDFVIRSKEITQSILEGFGNSFLFLNNLTFRHG
ncbi:Leucine-rich repeat, cysteine-containing subtype [Artemisia annua]|uniref:Leucine-rich repeat, cysteine-containing subtype n=1 Tax=Artemisia annua TaxID=35608 RepID=A0A2U1M6I7_ARTAN|nr:Leucine-rich repeat, cysteine-containing subtype [Artemisia annua]